MVGSGNRRNFTSSSYLHLYGTEETIIIIIIITAIGLSPGGSGYFHVYRI